MIIYLASDHRGFTMKQALIAYLSSKYATVDCGNDHLDPADDHIDFVNVLSEKMAHDPDGLGIVLCGSGCGVNIGVNRYAHLRATTGHSIKQITADCHDDLINVLSIGAEYVSIEEAKLFVDTFISSPRSKEERFLRRVAKFEQLGSRIPRV